MPGPIILCTDGSDLSVHAIQQGLAVMRADTALLLATVIDPPDAMLVTGTGFAGGTMSEAELGELEEQRETDASQLLHDIATRLELPSAELRVIRGSAGHALCDLADELGAAALVLGSRGHSGFARAVLGSVSDHVVRHATQPVVVIGPEAENDDA